MESNIKMTPAIIRLFSVVPNFDNFLEQFPNSKLRIPCRKSLNVYPQKILTVWALILAIGQMKPSPTLSDGNPSAGPHEEI